MLIKNVDMFEWTVTNMSGGHPEAITYGFCPLYTDIYYRQMWFFL